MAIGKADASTRSRPMTLSEKKVILAPWMGTFFDWHDFYLYGSLSAHIGAKFFTNHPDRLADAAGSGFGR